MKSMYCSSDNKCCELSHNGKYCIDITEKKLPKANPMCLESVLREKKNFKTSEDHQTKTTCICK